MEYTLNDLNIDEEGSYIFVSKNGRRYELADCSTFPGPMEKAKSFDILIIFDPNFPFPDGYDGTKLVGWMYGAGFLTTDRDIENKIRGYVNDFEKENKDLLFNKKITQEMLDALNEELLAKGCLFRYIVRRRNDDGTIETIERVLCNDTWISSSIINATDEFYEWFEKFFREYGIEIHYNNTRDISWAAK